MTDKRLSKGTNDNNNGKKNTSNNNLGNVGGMHINQIYQNQAEKVEKGNLINANAKLNNLNNNFLNNKLVDGQKESNTNKIIQNPYSKINKIENKE